MQLNSSIPRRWFLQLTAGTAAYTGLSRNVIGPLALGAKSDGRTLTKSRRTLYVSFYPEVHRRRDGSYDNALSYPVISMRPEITDHGSHDNLVGPHATPEQEAQLSNELHVAANSPPAFLFATTDDGVVPVLNSTAFYTAYVEKKLSVEIHLFEHGPHGVVLAQNLLGPSAWPNLLATWMFRHGWMEK
jgi:hypothetical protein